MKSPLKGSWSFTETLLLHILWALPEEAEDLPVTCQWTEEEAVVDLLARYRSPVMDDYLLIHVRKASVEDFSTHSAAGPEQHHPTQEAVAAAAAAAGEQ